MFRVSLIALPALILSHTLSAQHTSGPRYGKGCGIAGIDPDLRYAVESLITYQDTATIQEWLHDTDPVVQAYAVESLIRLQRKGMELSDAASARIATLRRSKRLVTVCSGCMHWEMPLNDAVNMFTEQDH